MDQTGTDDGRAGEAGEAASDGQASGLTSEVLTALQETRAAITALQQGFQRDINAIKSGYDRSLNTVREEVAQLRQGARGRSVEDIHALLNNPNLDEMERMRLQNQLYQQQLQEERQAREKAEEKARWDREVSLAQQTMGRVLGELGLTGKEEGLPQNMNYGERPLEFQARYVDAALDIARHRSEERARSAAAGRQRSPQPQEQPPPAAQPQFDRAAPQGVPAGTALSKLTRGTPAERRHRAEAIERASDDRGHVTVEEAARLA